jgi:hypothetical protein
MDEGRTQSVRKVALASFVGTTIEWYDFFRERRFDRERFREPAGTT